MAHAHQWRSGEQKVFETASPTGNLNYWTTAAPSSLLALRSRAAGFTLESIDPETKHIETLYTLKHSPTPFAGMSLTPDGKRVIFAELDRASSGLTLVDHFD